MPGKTNKSVLLTHQGRQDLGTSGGNKQIGKSTSIELSDTLGHVQRCQHFFEDGSFHIGASEVCLL